MIGTMSQGEVQKVRIVAEWSFEAIISSRPLEGSGHQGANMLLNWIYDFLSFIGNRLNVFKRANAFIMYEVVIFNKIVDCLGGHGATLIKNQGLRL